MMTASSKMYSGVFAGLVLSVLVHIGLGNVVHAEGEGPYRIAVVNMAYVMQRAPQSVKESERLEGLYMSREKALAAKQEEWRNAEEALSRDHSTLTNSQLAARESELRALQRSLKRQREDLREEIRVDKDQALYRLQGKVAQAIEAVREQESLDIIFRESDYIVASQRINITGKVLDKLQKRFEASQAKSNQQSPSNQPTSSPNKPSKDDTVTGE